MVRDLEDALARLRGSTDATRRDRLRLLFPASMRVSAALAPAPARDEQQSSPGRFAPAHSRALLLVLRGGPTLGPCDARNQR